MHVLGVIAQLVLTQSPFNKLWCTLTSSPQSLTTLLDLRCFYCGFFFEYYFRKPNWSCFAPTDDPSEGSGSWESFLARLPQIGTLQGQLSLLSFRKWTIKLLITVHLCRKINLYAYFPPARRSLFCHFLSSTMWQLCHYLSQKKEREVSSPAQVRPPSPAVATLARYNENGETTLTSFYFLMVHNILFDLYLHNITNLN